MALPSGDMSIPRPLSECIAPAPGLSAPPLERRFYPPEYGQVTYCDPPTTEADSETPLNLHTRRYLCPGCNAWIQRKPRGGFRYHGATLERGRRCSFPESDSGEGNLYNINKLQELADRYPQFFEVYLQVWRRLDHEIRNPPKLGRPPKADADGWRWNKPK